MLTTEFDVFTVKVSGESFEQLCDQVTSVKMDLVKQNHTNLKNKKTKNTHQGQILSTWL